jgi:transcriptional regulator CtsR
VLVLAKLCEIIEEFIKHAISVSDGVVEIQRNELASRFNCVPSQINYVIDTRFTLERGYYVESRRGGGGHIKIKEVFVDDSSFLMHMVNSIGSSVSQQVAEALVINLRDYNIISKKESHLMRAAVSDKILGSLLQRDQIRAQLLKNMLIVLV